MELIVSAYEESRVRELNTINKSIEIIKNNTNADTDGGLRTSMSEFLECNKLEKIYVDAVIKKNIELIGMKWNFGANQLKKWNFGTVEPFFKSFSWKVKSCRVSKFGHQRFHGSISLIN